MIFNISSIVNEPFLIDGATAQGLTPVVAGMINGTYVNEIKDFSIERARLAPFAIMASTEAVMSAQKMAKDSFQNNKSDYIGVIQISGVVLKADQACGPRGTKSLTSQVNAYKNDDSCIGLISVIDTPGGQVSYTDLLADAIRGFGKPTASYVEGMAASAGYWLASSSDKIFTSSALDSVGSIGAFASFIDFTEHLEKEGIKIIEIYAPQSTDKNKMYKDALAGNTDPYAKEVLQPIVEKFINDIQINRTSIDASVLKGTMCQSDKAMENGMIDGIKSFDEVVSYILEENANENLNDNDNMSATTKNFPNLAKTAGFDGDEINLTDGEASINEATMDAVETRLGEVDALETNVSTVTGEREALQTQFDDLTAEFEAYKGSAGAGGASGKKDGDAFGDTGKVNVDEFAHNKDADELLGK